MARMASTLFLGCALLVATLTASAQSSIVETPLFGTADKKVGSEYRKDLIEAVEMLMHGDAAGAAPVLARIRAYCDAQQRPGRRIVSVANQREYDEFMAGHGDGEPVEWIDIACPSAYHMTGYALVGQKKYAEALPWLGRASALAPYLGDARNERAFVLGGMGKHTEALAAYREVIALADAHPSAAYIKPLALRGEGYVLIELGDLDGAQRAYEASLVLDPNNTLAKGELEFIQKRREAAAPAH